MFTTPMLFLLTAVGADPAPPKPIVVHIGFVTVLKMSTGKDVLKAACDKNDVIGLSASSPKEIVITAKSPGTDRVELTDSEGTKESFQIIVRRRVEVPLGVPLSWRWPTDEEISRVAFNDEKLARVQKDPKLKESIRIEPLAEGEGVVTLTDAKGKSETVTLFVRKPDHLIAVGESIRIQPTSKKPIRRFSVQDVRIAMPEWKGGEIVDISSGGTGRGFVVAKPGESDSLSLVGAEPGLTRVFIVDTEGKDDLLWIGVKPKP